MSFLTTAQKLKTILDTVSAAILPLKFEYQETKPASFPSGNIIYLGGNEKMLDTITNEVLENFVIRLIFPTEEGQVAMEKWLTLVDAIGDAFRKDDYQTLTGSAVSFQVKSYAPPITTSDYSQVVMVFDIMVEAKILKAINL